MWLRVTFLRSILWLDVFQIFNITTTLSTSVFGVLLYMFIFYSFTKKKCFKRFRMVFVHRRGIRENTHMSIESLVEITYSIKIRLTKTSFYSRNSRNNTIRYCEWVKFSIHFFAEPLRRDRKLYICSFCEKGITAPCLVSILFIPSW